MTKRSPRRRGVGGSEPARKARTAPPPKAKERLDVTLVSRGLSETREKAARLILAGQVMVDGQRMDKAGAFVDKGARVELVARQ